MVFILGITKYGNTCAVPAPKTGRLTERMAEQPASVPGPSKAITLCPLKSVGNLRERYSEATADVVFVGKERLPAHRAVLSVASSVFFKMFDGDWKESRERNIPAPTEYRWEAFKAAITLLYGVQVELDASSVLDVFRVAHVYELVNVKLVLAQAISQWDEDMVDTVLELCALVGVLETEEDQREHEVLRAGSSYIVKHLALIKEKPTGLNGLPYEAMLKVVQSEGFTAPELDIFLLLKRWMKEHQDITLRQAQQLYSHIRYGMIPYEYLSHEFIHENHALTLQNHRQLSVDKMKNNLKLVTPRLCQSEVLQVYPLVAGLSVSRKIGRWDFKNIVLDAKYTMGVIFSGKQELTFQLNLSFKNLHQDNMEAFRSIQLCVELSSVCDQMDGTKPAKAKVPLFQAYERSYLSYLVHTITLKSTGARLIHSQCETRRFFLDNFRTFLSSTCKTKDLPFRGPFPWMLKIAVPCNKSVSMTVQVE